MEKHRKVLNQMANNTYTCLIVGENTAERTAKYTQKYQETPRTLYRKEDRKAIKESFIKARETWLKVRDASLARFDDFVTDEIKKLHAMKDKDFFSKLAGGKDCSIDAKTGNIITFLSENYKADFIMPIEDGFILKDGKKVSSAKKGNIDWGAMHMANTKKYEIAWDCVMGTKSPVTDEERNIYENMKGLKPYLASFGDRETYIKSSCSFVAYAVLTKEDEWLEMDETQNQYTWTAEFYDRFIVPLSDDTLLTLSLCTLRDENELKS